MKIVGFLLDRAFSTERSNSPLDSLIKVCCFKSNNQNNCSQFSWWCTLQTWCICELLLFSHPSCLWRQLCRSSPRWTKLRIIRYWPKNKLHWDWPYDLPFLIDWSPSKNSSTAKTATIPVTGKWSFFLMMKIIHMPYLYTYKTYKTASTFTESRRQQIANLCTPGNH